MAKHTFQKAVAVVTCGLTLCATITSWSRDACADEVSPKGKGIVGGALLGGEIVTIPMSLFHVKSGWAYVIGGGLGMIGGGVGGYAIERASFSSDGRVPTYMLAGGLALVIPTVVLILNATRYESPEATEDHAPTNAPPADPGKVGGSVVIGGEGTSGTGTNTTGSTPAAAPPQGASGTTPQPGTNSGGGGTSPPAIPLSLIDWHRGVRMGLPLPEIRETYTPEERRALGVPQETQVRMPIFHATF